ncbi:MAG: hypothetical protein ACTSQJ_18580 [Promethearchaeota archaeon]
MDSRKDQAAKIVKEYEEKNALLNAEEMIKDNKIYFSVDGKKYRVRLLNLAERNELDNLRRRKFGELIQDKNILMEKDLIVQYKERGIDIDEIDDKIHKLRAQWADIELKLGEALSKNEADIILNSYKENIEEFKREINILNSQKAIYLEFSLENQLLSYVAQIFTYLSLEKHTEEGWKRMFKTIEEFETSPEEKVINTAAQYSIILQSL